MKKQENVTREIELEIARRLGLGDMDFKIAIVNMFKDLKRKGWS